MLGREVPPEVRASGRRTDKAWPQNVPTVYAMLKWCSAHTSHQIALDMEEDNTLLYEGPQDAEAAMKLWTEGHSANLVVSGIELVRSRLL